MPAALMQWNNGSITICPEYLLYYVNGKKIRNVIEEDFNTYCIYADYKPISVLDTTHHNSSENKEIWLKKRCAGIGGSESAAARGKGKWQTKLDVYNEKIGIHKKEKVDWVTLEHGHILEPLIRTIFQRKTGYPVFEEKRMLRHPFFPFMLADVDGICKLPDGSYAILEIKTTNRNNLREWEDGKIPLQYMEQGRHYMAVLNLNKVYFICYHGNSSKDVIIRTMDRDYQKEKEMIVELQNFWYHNVIPHIPPVEKQTEQTVAMREEYQNYVSIEPLDQPFLNIIQNYLKEKENLMNEEKKAKEKLTYLQEKIVQRLGNAAIKTFKGDGNCYTISYRSSQPYRVISAENLEHMMFQDPEIYKRYTTEKTKKPVLRIKEGR